MFRWLLLIPLALACNTPDANQDFQRRTRDTPRSELTALQLCDAYCQLIPTCGGPQESACQNVCAWEQGVHAQEGKACSDAWAEALDCLVGAGCDAPASCDAAIAAYSSACPATGSAGLIEVSPGNNGGDCDKNGFTALSQQLDDKGGGNFVFYAVNGETEPYDLLAIENYVDFDGAISGPGIYTIADVNYADCGLCVTARTGCTQGGGCQKTFYAKSGMVQVTSVGDGAFAATLTNLKLREVTLDTTTYASADVPGGQDWCIGRFEASGEAAVNACIDTEFVADSSCVSAGNGTRIHHNIGDFSLTKCNGDTVQLHDACDSDVKAIWLMATAGWCGACEAALPGVVDAVEAYAGKVKLFVVLGEDQFSGEPSQTYCESYAESHGLDESQLVIDHNGTYGFVNLFSHVDICSSGDSFGLPWTGLLDARNMEYVYSSESHGYDALSTTVSALVSGD
jgi:hypothetical protein